MSNKTYGIYALNNGSDDGIFYIGKSVDPHARFISHRTRSKRATGVSKRASQPVHQWIKRHGLVETFNYVVLIDGLSADDCERLEADLIRHFRPICNAHVPAGRNVDVTDNVSSYVPMMSGELVGGRLRMDVRQGSKY